MKTHDILTALQSVAAGVTVNAAPAFAAVAVYDADQPQTQADILQETDGRFCLIVHGGNDLQMERAGRETRGALTVKASLFVSNSHWGADGENTPASASAPLDVVDALVAALTAHANDKFWQRVASVERYSSPATGTADGRLIYHVAVECAVRERIIIPLGR
ncbi:MAG: hypothetical protein LBD30_00345 [Verrucomicrobiales bacterium]|jgi:hypothetical protein|nr:hypothetical protein [Verrucomicrobiales bacterium]